MYVVVIIISITNFGIEIIVGILNIKIQLQLIAFLFCSTYNIYI